jgi:hypothetical protein
VRLQIRFQHGLANRALSGPCGGAA